jgi:hypothetical protein
MSLLMLATLTLTAAAFAGLAISAAITIVRAVRTGGRRDESIERDDARSTSRFTIPVSIVVFGKETDPLSSIAGRLLALNYPEIEVLLVCDASTRFVASMREDWDIEAREFFYRKTLPATEVRRIYRSAKDPRLVLIDTPAAHYADAMNCGFNVARYRFVASIAPDVTFDADALLRLMAAPLIDPGRVVGASALIERGEGAGRLAAARALMSRRLTRGWRGGLDTADAVIVWRRDAVLKQGGVPADAAAPALALAAALQSSGSHRFETNAGIFGRADALALTTRIARFFALKLALLGVLSRSVRSRRIDRPTLRLLRSGLLVPLVATWIVGACAGAALAGWTSWIVLPLAIIVLAFGRASVTSAALLLRGAVPGAPDERALRRLLLSAPIDPGFRA